MRVLIVAMVNSIHTARWVNQLVKLGWDVHIFPSFNTYHVHPEIKNVTIYSPGLPKSRIKDNKNKSTHNKLVKRLHYLFSILLYGYRKYLNLVFKNYYVFCLKRAIRKFKPDIVHSLEFQAAGYLTLKAKKEFNGKFPKWIATNWGSDIYLFGRLSEHTEKIRELLAECDFYSCECKRDAYLARAYGFKKDILPIFPNTGGFNVDKIQELRSPGPISKRKFIMLKGYQGWAGRALTGLRALERCSDLLLGYSIFIVSPANEVAIAAELFTRETGIPTRVIPWGTPHEEIMGLHGQARISIGLSISDGISTSFLEAIAMGSFPIQSFTACANEWIVDGKTGILVHPDDSDDVERAIRRALTDDALVNNAAAQNFNLLTERLDHNVILSKVVEFYEIVINSGKKGEENGPVA